MSAGNEVVKPTGLILSPSGEASALLTVRGAPRDRPASASGYWTAIDEATASQCLALIAREGDGDDRWRVRPMAATLGRGSGKTRDVEALARHDSTTDPAVHSTALAAHGLAAAAIALLPPDLQDRLGEVVLEPATVSMTPVELIRAADAAAQRHPIQQLPTGAREVIVALRDLIGQTRS